MWHTLGSATRELPVETTKPTLSSKTVLMNLALAIYAAGVAFFDLPAGLDSPETLAVVGIVGNLVAAWFRKTATAKLV